MLMKVLGFFLLLLLGICPSFSWLFIYFPFCSVHHFRLSTSKRRGEAVGDRFVSKCFNFQGRSKAKKSYCWHRVGGGTLFILNLTFLGLYLVLIVDECTLIWLHVRRVSTVHRTYTRTYRQEDNVILQDIVVVNKSYYV